jgi:hypothetical protein
MDELFVGNRVKPREVMSVGNHAKAAAAPRTLHSILPAAYVGQMLQRERARSERNGHEFAVVLFRVRHRHRSAMRLAREVLKRIRFTDEVGWLNRRYLCDSSRATANAGSAFTDIPPRQRASGRPVPPASDPIFNTSAGRWARRPARHPPRHPTCHPPYQPPPQPPRCDGTTCYRSLSMA